MFYDVNIACYQKSHCLNRGKREDEKMMLWEWARQFIQLMPLHDLGRSLIASTPHLFNSLPCSWVMGDHFPTELRENRKKFEERSG